MLAFVLELSGALIAATEVFTGECPRGTLQITLDFPSPSFDLDTLLSLSRREAIVLVPAPSMQTARGRRMTWFLYEAPNQEGRGRSHSLSCSLSFLGNPCQARSEPANKEVVRR